MLTVAIASESCEYDGEVFRLLAERILGAPVQRWDTEIRFRGWPSVRKRAPLYLELAAKDQVRYAILAVDNDGYADTRIEHADDHHPSAQAALGCRECWLRTVPPPEWTKAGGQHCVAVPVQTLETWLIHARGFPPLVPSPEQVYDRRELKLQLFGEPESYKGKKLEIAKSALDKPGALDRLRERPSFQRFEAQLLAWKL
jgi:hypothetical protein